MTEPPGLPNGGSSLFSENLLVVRQDPEIVDSTPLYAILDRRGTRVGAVADVGQRDLRTAFRLDRFMGQAPPGIESPPRGLMSAFKAVSSVRRQARYRLEVRNEVGMAVLVLTSAEFWEDRALIQVARGNGVPIGTITLQSTLRKPRYALETAGERVGTIVADRWYSLHHHVLDAQKRKVAQIAPRRQGWVARALTREPATFAVQISLPLPDPLHSLLLAGALTADTALKRHEPSDV